MRLDIICLLSSTNNQFHQHFRSSFCADILYSPNSYRAKLKVEKKLLVKCWCNWHQGLILPTGFYASRLHKKTVKSPVSFCAFGICAKKLRVKCWWNWHQVDRQRDYKQQLLVGKLSQSSKTNLTNNFKGQS